MKELIAREAIHGDRKWVKGWSPEQIANQLQIKSMRISHEATYQALYIQGRGALKRELVSCLRTGRALRVPREPRQKLNEEWPRACWLRSCYYD